MTALSARKAILTLEVHSQGVARNVCFPAEADVANRPVADIRSMVEGDLQLREVPMLKYQCCFCATRIERPDQQGVRLSLIGMGRDPAAQDLFAHITCLGTRFSPTLAAETVFDARAFEPE